MRIFKLPVNDEILKNKAQYYGQMLNIENFKYSNGWLHGFKSRYNISMRNLHGEGGSVFESMFKKERALLKEIFASFNKDDNYNADEFALFYKLLPNRTLSKNKNENGLKTIIERITCMVCCSASGNDKPKMLIINKTKTPRSFSRTRFKAEKYVHYYYNKTT